MPRPRSRYRRRKKVPWRWLACLIAAAVLLVLYLLGALPWRPPAAHAPTMLNLVDPEQQPVTAPAPGWDYSRTLQADLDSDGAQETVHVLARVSRVPGRIDEYMWDDGQPWQVYIQDGDRVTHVYARFVQLGRLDVLITDEERPRLAIVEAQGAGYALYTVVYDGPDQVTLRELARLPVREYAWMP
jgi:hypothetical protein